MTKKQQFVALLEPLRLHYKVGPYEWAKLVAGYWGWLSDHPTDVVAIAVERAPSVQPDEPPTRLHMWGLAHRVMLERSGVAWVSVLDVIKQACASHEDATVRDAIALMECNEDWGKGSFITAYIAALRPAKWITENKEAHEMSVEEARRLVADVSCPLEIPPPSPDGTVTIEHAKEMWMVDNCLVFGGDN